jgi:hypothetical protein
MPLAALLIVATSARAEAQTPAAPNELAVFAGASLVSAETNDVNRPIILRGAAPAPLIFPPPFEFTSALDGSAEFGARYSRYITDRFAATFDYSVAPSHELTETIRYRCPDGRLCIQLAEAALVVPDQQFKSKVVAHHYGAGVGVDLMQGSLKPSFMAGLGGVTYDTEGQGGSRFAVRIGAALRAESGPTHFRLELLDVITPDHIVTTRAEHDLHVRVGLGVRW